MTQRCPITYELCGQARYSEKGLHLLDKHLTHLEDFPHTAQEQIQLAGELATKLSIQGVQPKLSLVLNVKHSLFEIVDHGGRFILKPPHFIYPELPQNEDVTMRLADLAGINVPLHGLIYNIDHSMSYFIKRFDRLNQKKKLGVEDFSQLSGATRDTKYESSMEKVAAIIEKQCTFPALEKLKLFRLVIFNFLVGNEDMHLKNFSLIRRKNSVIELTPAYDLLSTTIAMKQVTEEVALPIRGKKSRLTRADFIDYFGSQRLQLSPASLAQELARFEDLSSWHALIKNSFLSEDMRDRYLYLLMDRARRLGAGAGTL